MSDPSEPSERMERADNPSKAMKWALILGGVAAVGTAAVLLTRKKRVPLPSQEQIAAGNVPGVTMDAQPATQVQIGLKVAANPFSNATVSVSRGPTEAELGQKVTDIYNWSRPILAFAFGITMQSASMAGYRRLNGPFDALQSGLQTVSKVATTASNTLQKAEDAVAAANRIQAQQAQAPVTVSDNGWPEVYEWLKTGRLPLSRNKVAWNYALLEVGRLGGHYFSTAGDGQFNFGRNFNFHTGVAGTCFTPEQVVLLHGYTRQMYDLWTRGGANAQAIPQDTTWVPKSSLRNYPFKYLQMLQNKG